MNSFKLKPSSWLLGFALLSYSLGAVWGFYAFWTSLVLVALACIGAWAAWFLKLRSLLWPMAGLLFFALGAVRVQQAQESKFLPGSSLTPRKIWFEGKVGSYPKKFEREAFGFQVELSGWKPGEVWRTFSGRARIFVAKGSVPARGQQVKFRARLRTPRNLGNRGEFDGVRYQRTRGVDFKGSVSRPQDLILGDAPDRTWTRNLNQVRTKAQDLSEQVMSPEASAIFQAMVFGDRAGVKQETLTAFRRMGVIHLLVVSGFHVGVVALFFGGLAGWLWRRSHVLVEWLSPKVVSAWSALLGAWVVVSLTDLPVSTVRALIFFVLGLVALMVVRPKKIWGVILGTALFLLGWQPLFLFDVSAQLSFAAVVGIGLALNWKVFPKQGRVKQLFWISLGAWMGTLPILIWHFGQVTFWGPLANVFFIPLLGIVGIPLGLLATVSASIFPSLGGLLFRCLGAWIDLLHRILVLSSDLPGTDLWFSHFQFFLILPLVLMGFWFLAKGFTGGRRWVGVGLAFGLGLVAWFGESLFQPSAIHFLHVGQGDASVMVTDQHGVVLIDAGRGGPYQADAGERTLLPWFRHEGHRSLDLMVLTHEDMDHVGGAETILRSMPVKELWVPNLRSDGRTMKRLLALARQKGTRMVRVNAGRQRWNLDNLELSVLHPPTLAKSWSQSDNENSIVIRAQLSDSSVLFTGDIEAQAEAWLVTQNSQDDLKVDILKVAHHGSRRSSTPTFLSAVKAQDGVIPVGWMNPYGHPASQVLQSLREAGVRVWRGDLCGQISVRPGLNDSYEIDSVRGCEKTL